MNGGLGSGAYVVEAYLARSADATLCQLAGELRTAAEDASRDGAVVRYVGTIFVPDDEICFHLYEADAADSVRKAIGDAGVRAERVTPAVQVGAWMSSRRAGPDQREE